MRKRNVQVDCWVSLSLYPTYGDYGIRRPDKIGIQSNMPTTLVALSQPLIAAHSRQPQPMIKATPPIGVIAPSQRTPVSDRI